MNSTNDEKEVKSDQTCGPKGKTYYIEIYKALETRLRGNCDLNERTRQLCEAWRIVHTLCERSASSTHHHLLNWLERHTSRTILLTEWQSPKSKDDHTSLSEAIVGLIQKCKAAITERNGFSPPWEVQVVERGEWYRRTLENPWGHPVLRVLLDPRCQQPSNDEILEWLKEERGLTFALRLLQLSASKCDDLAATLVGAVMDRVRADLVPVPDHEQLDKEDPPDEPTEPNEVLTFAKVLKTEAGFTQDLWELLADLEFVLLHKCDKVSKCIELAKQTPLRSGYLQVERLQNRRSDQPREKKLWKNAKEVAVLIAQVVIARCMVVPVCAHAAVTALYRCARGLARTVPASRLPAAAATLAAPAATARHLHTLAAAVHAQCTTETRPFVCELYVRAITAGMNELERLKLKTEKASEARATEQTLSSWFTQLGGLLSASDRIKCECMLTAFSVHPSPAMYERIKAAPVLPPVAGTEELNVKEETTSEFGSWATDSRTQTNLVKTSETLNIKQTQQQTNVLSTAILTEGEALGLTPELCQDLAVLLSGPRVKTLSWDMNRDLLLENCRTYMERTHGGTRALTTELKYLNLDPRYYEHLPVEEEDENDLYYGIEKGYEHLVEFEEQEDIWQSTMFDIEKTETTSSCGDTDFEQFKRKKKVKKQVKVVTIENEKDPLSIDPEIKSETKKERESELKVKKERPHSKERISEEKTKLRVKKERKKKEKPNEESGTKNDHSLERPKDLEQKEESGSNVKEKKKEKKPRKKKPKEIKDEFPIPSKPGSLSNLIGLKVTKISTPPNNYMEKNAISALAPCITDRNYDSQGKSPLASLNLEGNDPNVLFDGLFSMDDYKSPEKPDPLSDRKHPSKQDLSYKVTQTAINTMQTPKYTDLEKTNTNLGKVSEEVKKSITKLIEYRRQKSLSEITQKVVTVPTSSQKPVIKNNKPNAIIQQVFPEQTMISPKAVNVPEIPKVYINKKQAEQSLSEVVNSVKLNVPQRSDETLPRTINMPQNILHSNYNTSPSTCTYQETTIPRTNSPSQSNPNLPLDLQQTPRQSNDSPTQQNFEDFIKELTKSINAGILQTKSNKSDPANKTVKKGTDLNNVTPDVSPIRYVKNQQRKKVEMQLDTFSRRSYMHKNKLLGNIKSQYATDSHKIEESKATKLKNTDTKQTVINNILAQNSANTSAIVQNVIMTKEKSFETVQNFSNYLKVDTPKPFVYQNTHGDKNIKASQSQDNAKTLAPSTYSRESLLSEKDQIDILQILRQKNDLNKQLPFTVFNNDRLNLNIIENNPQYTKQNISSKEMNSGSATNSCIRVNSNLNHKFENSQMTVSGLPSQTSVPVANIKTHNSNKPPSVLNTVLKNLNMSQNQQTSPQFPHLKTAKTTKSPSILMGSKNRNVTQQPVTEPSVNIYSRKVTSKKKDTSQEWTKVMDALLAQKTPTRGINALDMTLMQGNYSDLCKQTTTRPTIIRHSNNNKEYKAENINNNQLNKVSSEGSITKVYSEPAGMSELSKTNLERQDVGHSYYGIKIQKMKCSDSTAEKQSKYSNINSLLLSNVDSEAKGDYFKTPFKIKDHALKKPTSNIQASDIKPQSIARATQNKKKTGQSPLPNVEQTVHIKKTITLPTNQLLAQDLSKTQEIIANISRNAEQSISNKNLSDVQLKIQDLKQISCKQYSDKLEARKINYIGASSMNEQMSDRLLSKQCNNQTYEQISNKDGKVSQAMSLNLSMSHKKKCSGKQPHKNVMPFMPQKLEKSAVAKESKLNKKGLCSGPGNVCIKKSEEKSNVPGLNRSSRINELSSAPYQIHRYNQHLQQEAGPEKPYTCSSKAERHILTKKHTDVLANNQFSYPQQTQHSNKRLNDKEKLLSLQQDYVKRLTRGAQVTVTYPRSVEPSAEKLIQEKDPFISGFDNSDYDFLEELMDDELRQEIGELSSDEGDTADAISNVKPSKLSSNTFEGDNMINKNTRTKINEFTGNYSQQKSYQSVVQPLNKTNINKFTFNYNECKSSILSPSITNIADNKQLSKDCDLNLKMSSADSTVTSQSQTANTNMLPSVTVQKHHVLTNSSSVINFADKKNFPKNCQLNAEIPVVGKVSCQNQTSSILSNQSVHQEPSILATNSVNVLDARNIIIASLPQPATRNLVLIRPQLVYNPYTEVCNITQRPYITVHNTPNVTIYQTTQIPGPVVNPIITRNTTVSTPLSSEYLTSLPTTGTDTSTMNPKSIQNQDLNAKNNIQHFFSEFKANNDVVAKQSTTLINNTLESDQQKKTSTSIETKLFEDKIIPIKRNDIDDISSSKTKQILKQNETTISLDINKNCERKVLAEVQEKLITDKIKQETLKELEKNDNKQVAELNKIAVIEEKNDNKQIAELNKVAVIEYKNDNKQVAELNQIAVIEGKHGNKQVAEQNKIAIIENEETLKRIKSKRFAIINRQIHYRSAMPPIVLSCLPPAKSNADHMVAQSKINSVIDNSVSDENITISEDKLLENSKENSKEIKRGHILLRSSKKSISDKASIYGPHTKTPDETLKIKIKLNRNISERQARRPVKNKRKRESTIKNKSIAKRRTYKVQRNKNNKSKDSGSVPPKLPQTENNTKVSKNCHKIINETLMDFEENLLASRIPKYDLVKPLQPSRDEKCLQSTNTISVYDNNDDNERKTKVVINQDKEETLTHVEQQTFLESQKDLDPPEGQKINAIVEISTNSDVSTMTPERIVDRNFIDEHDHILKESPTVDKTNDIVVEDAKTEEETRRNDMYKITTDKDLNEKKKTMNESSGQKQEECVATASEKNCQKIDQSQSNNSFDFNLLKDNISIEPLPFSNEDSNKRCVRVKLPNGKVFKATVFGQNNVSIESLFANEYLKTTLMQNMQSSQRYTVNIKHVVKPSEVNPEKIVDMEIENINLEPSRPITKPIECVSLLSDDEDEVDKNVRSLKTEFGTFKVTLLESEDYIKHQMKLNQVCVVILTKCNSPVNKPQSEILQLPVNPGFDSLRTTETKSETPELSTRSKLNIIDKNKTTVLSYTQKNSKVEDQLESVRTTYADSQKINETSQSSSICLKPMSLESISAQILDELNKQNGEDSVTNLTMHRDTQVDNESANSCNEILQKESRELDVINNESVTFSKKSNIYDTNLNSGSLNVATKDFISKLNPLPSEIIELDDSSNDSIDLLRDCSFISNHLDQTAYETPVPDKTDEKQSEKIIELKELLLKDLGFVDLENNDTCRAVDTNNLDDQPCEENPLLKTKNCMVELIKCDELVKKYEYEKIINQKCFVDLVRCDAKPNSAANEIACMIKKRCFSSDASIDVCIEDDITSCSNLSRSGSFSLLTDFPVYIENTSHNFASSNYSKDDRSSSPVIEIFETIAAFNKYSRTNNESIFNLNENMVLDSYHCYSDWNKTKKEFSKESKIMNNQCKSATKNYTYHYQKKCSPITEFIVNAIPSLKSLTTTFFQDYAVLDRYSLIRHLTAKVPIKQCNKLKRKWKNGVSTSESSIEKRICRNYIISASYYKGNEIKSDVNCVSLKCLNSEPIEADGHKANSVVVGLIQENILGPKDRICKNRNKISANKCSIALKSYLSSELKRISIDLRSQTDITKENGSTTSVNISYLTDKVNKSCLNKCEENDFDQILTKKLIVKDDQISNFNPREKQINEIETDDMKNVQANKTSKTTMQITQERNENFLLPIPNKMVPAFDSVYKFENIKNEHQSSTISPCSSQHVTENDCEKVQMSEVKEIVETVTSLDSRIDQKNHKEQTEMAIVKNVTSYAKAKHSVNIVSVEYGINKQAKLEKNNSDDLENVKHYNSRISSDIVKSESVATISEQIIYSTDFIEIEIGNDGKSVDPMDSNIEFGLSNQEIVSDSSYGIKNEDITILHGDSEEKYDLIETACRDLLDHTYAIGTPLHYAEPEYNINECEESYSETVSLEDTELIEDSFDESRHKEVTLVYKDGSDLVLKGIEYEDPVIGTCYVFPLTENRHLPHDCDEYLNDLADPTEEQDNAFDIELTVDVPKLTYSKNVQFKARKRKLSDVQIYGKKYRKGKNIDYPKLTATATANSTYSKEYKQVFDYCDSLKISFSQPYHKEIIDVESIMKNWPIKHSLYARAHNSDSQSTTMLFQNAEEVPVPVNPLTLTLVEEMNANYSDDTEQTLLQDSVQETNFNMGFGERSDRVIQNLKDRDDVSSSSAATLSDVKQPQPFLMSEDKYQTSILDTAQEQARNVNRFVKCIQLRDKVRSFFERTKVELQYDCIKKCDKENILDTQYSFNNNIMYPFDHCGSDFMDPSPCELVVQVVQVGQSPVSATVQNAITCDQRVAQASDVSPSQCPLENSLQVDSEVTIKTEYTELTTSDFNHSLVQEYVQKNHTLPIESQKQSNIMSSNENIPTTDTELKSVVKIEIIEELPEVKKENEYFENNDTESLENQHTNNATYSMESNNYVNHVNKETDVGFQTSYQSLPEKQNAIETCSQPKEKNSIPEKTDQIAHAMNAAGINTTSESMTNINRAHALVNIVSQKITPENLNTAQTGNNNSYTKTTAINALSLQQALAQILPPPLNQNGCADNNQQSNNPQVTPQVLHIVQGKNSTGNQITLVDNTHPSVINTPNAAPVLHIVQNKAGSPGNNSSASAAQPNSFSGISLVDTGLQQGGNQLLHIVNTGCQKNNNATGQLLKRVNLLTNLANVQGGNDQKMVQFVCKSADGKTIQLNAPHQRSMVLRLQPIEQTNIQTSTPKSVENHEVTSTINSTTSKESNSSQEIKSRSVYEENYAKFIQNSKCTGSEKSTSLPKFNQAFGKPVFQEGDQKQNDLANSNSHLASVNDTSDSSECQSTDNAMSLDQIGQISSPPLLLRKSPAHQTTNTQAQANLAQQFKQTIAPMNIQTMHGGVIYTRQIPVIGGGQTINLITVPTTDLLDESTKQQLAGNHNEIEPSIIKIVPQNQPSTNTEASAEDAPATGVSNETPQNLPPQPVLTQMRIKLPMLSKTPQMMSGTRVMRPSFFQIQRNVIGGANQPVYQQLVLTAAPPLGQQTIRLPQAQSNRQIKVPTENQSSSESQMSSSTLEQLREFDMVLEQVKERSTTQPSGSNTTFSKLPTPAPSTDTTDNTVSASSTSAESTQQVLYSMGNNQPLNVAYVNRKTVTTPATSSLVRSPDSSGIVESSSANHNKTSHTKTSERTQNDAPATPTQTKPSKSSSKSKSKSKSTHHPMKLNTVPPKSSSQKSCEDELTTKRILFILAEYKEQVENSPDKNKPAPRRRTNPPLIGHSKRKKSTCSSRKHCCRELSPIHGDDTCRTMCSEDSCGTSLGDCNESCMEINSPQESPRKVARKLTFEQETPPPQPLPQPQRNVIVADGQTITVARGTAGKPTAVLMPGNYILPVSMVKGGQQIAIVTNRGPKLLTVSGGEGGTTNALLLQRLIGPAGLKPVLTRPGVRHVRLPTATLQNLHAFNLATTTSIQTPDSTAPTASAPTPPELVDTRATSSPWAERTAQDAQPENDSSPAGSEPWQFTSAVDPLDYSYEETVRTENFERTVLDPIPDRYSPDMEAQRIFDKMFDVESKKSYMGDSHGDSPRCAYDIDASDCDDKAYHQVVQKKDGTSHRQHRFNVSSAALRHKYAILEHELRLQKSLSEECEDLGVDSPSASELFPEAELLFSSSPAHEHVQEQGQHSHTPQPTILSQGGVPQPDLDDQIATDHLLVHNDMGDDQSDLNLGLDDVGGIVTITEDGQTTIALDHEEFARSHPNTTFHSEPTEETDMHPFTITGLKARHITSTIFHAGRAPATVLMAPQTTVISQATAVANCSGETVKYADIDNIIDSIPSANESLGPALVKDDGLTRYEGMLNDSRELHLSNTAAAIVHSTGNAAQVIRRVCYEDEKRCYEDDKRSYEEDKRDARYLIEPGGYIPENDSKMMPEENSRDAAFDSMVGDPEDDRSSPERHADMFWESNSASERSDRRQLDFSSDSDKCCKSPYYETNSTDSGGVGTHMRLDSVIKNARGMNRSGSADGFSAEDAHPPLRTYPPKKAYQLGLAAMEGEMERSLSGKTRAGERSPVDSLEGRRRASGRDVVKRGCHCCNGSPSPLKVKRSRPRKPTDFSNN